MNISPVSSQLTLRSTAVLDSSNERVNLNVSDDDSNSLFEANLLALHEDLSDTEVNKSY